jgi:3-oxoadipate CoA-transferase alpha subunit
MAVRRVVLGDAHVDRAVAATTDLTADFQRMITEYAWGTIWTRPGLDLRSRSMITLTAMVARGHHEELAMHLGAARRNGLTNDEIKEVLMQTAIYCGVPDAIPRSASPPRCCRSSTTTGSAVMSRTAFYSDTRDAVAGIEDGATILVGGFGMAGMPTTLIDALIEHGASDLTIVSNNAGNGDTGLAALLAAGRVSRVICSFPRQTDSYVFDALYREGKVAPRGGSAGQPGRAHASRRCGHRRVLLPDGCRHPLADGKETRTIDGRDYVLEYPIRGDVALIGAHVADRSGKPVVPQDGTQLRPGDGHRRGADHRGGRPCRRNRHHRPRTVVTPGIFVDRVLDLSSIPEEAASTETAVRQRTAVEHLDRGPLDGENSRRSSPATSRRAPTSISASGNHDRRRLPGSRRRRGPAPRTACSAWARVATGDDIDPDLTNAGKVPVTETPAPPTFTTPTPSR